MLATLFKLNSNRFTLRQTFLKQLFKFQPELEKVRNPSTYALIGLTVKW